MVVVRWSIAGWLSAENRDPGAADLAVRKAPRCVDAVLRHRSRPPRDCNRVQPRGRSAAAPSDNRQCRAADFGAGEVRRQQQSGPPVNRVDRGGVPALQVLEHERRVGTRASCRRRQRDVRRSAVSSIRPRRWRTKESSSLQAPPISLPALRWRLGAGGIRLVRQDRNRARLGWQSIPMASSIGIRAIPCARSIQLYWRAACAARPRCSCRSWCGALCRAGCGNCRRAGASKRPAHPI